MKRVLMLVAIVTALLLALGYTLGASAQDNGVQIVVNGKKIQCDPPAFVEDGQVFGPIEPLAEALGARVTWDKAENTIRVDFGFTISTIVLQTTSSTRIITFPAFSDQVIQLPSTPPSTPE